MALQGSRHLMPSDTPASSQGSSTRDAGPRIFVGKLVRGTTETDVRDYFSKFGYALSPTDTVYIHCCPVCLGVDLNVYICWFPLHSAGSLVTLTRSVGT